MIQELFPTLLQAVLIAAVPVITAFAVKFLGVKAKQVASQTDDKKTQSYIMEVSDAVTAAVAYTSQTYVDSIKKSGVFTEENQKEALQKAKEKASTMLSASAADFLNKSYGDATAYLEAKIEQEVRSQNSNSTVKNAPTSGLAQ